MSDVVGRPTLVGSVASGTSAAVAAVVAGFWSSPGLALAAFGGLVVGVSLYRGSPGLLDLGCLSIFFGIVLSGLEAAPPEWTVLGTLAVVVAWDVGTSAIELGEQLGREATTRRLEAVHIASGVTVGLVSVTIGLLVFSVAWAAIPVGALVLLLVAAVLVTIGLGGTGW